MTGAARDGAPVRRAIRAALVRPLQAMVRAYQLVLSPLLPTACRFAPSCSAYAIEALERHGPVKGSWLAIRRIARCHPWGGHGYDPVPEAPARSAVPQQDFSRRAPAGTMTRR